MDKFIKPQIETEGGSKDRGETKRRTRTQICSQDESEGNDTDGSMISVTSLASSASGAPRKRKTAATIGKNIPTKRLAADDQDTPFVVPARGRTKSTVPKTEELSKEMKEQPTADLEARIIESLATMEQVTDKSKYIKGDQVRALRMAVRTAQAATAEISARLSGERLDNLERENATLRKELATLNAKMDEMMAERTDRNPASQQLHQEKSPRSENVLTVEQVQDIVRGQIASLLDQNHPSGVSRLPLSQKAKPGSNPVPHGVTKPKKKKKAAHKNTETTLPESAPTQPRQESSLEESSWSKVLGRKAKAKAKAEVKKASAGQTAVQRSHKAPSKPMPPRLPKTAAIGITIPEGVQTTYAEVMSAAKDRIKLQELGISNVRQKRAANGGLLLEIAGADGADKADQLAERLQTALADLGARITRPAKTAELRVMDLDESVTMQDVANAVASAGSCRAEEVRVGEIRHSPKRLGTAWVRCPLSAAHKIRVAGRVQVGWVSVKVEVLAARPLQCYRCFHIGHTRHQCTSTVDHSTACFVCGEDGHKASNCTAAAPKCPLCAGLGRPADHRMGSKKCTPPKGKESIGGRRQPLPAATVNTAARTGKSITQAGLTQAPEEAMDS